MKIKHLTVLHEDAEDSENENTIAQNEIDLGD
jgi:hypothetical protein